MNEIQKLEAKPWKKLAESYRKILMSIVDSDNLPDDSVIEEISLLEVERDSLLQKERIQGKKEKANG